MAWIEKLTDKIKKKRGRNGIRLASKEIGISPATLSRIENGKLPDIETFRKICVWLNVGASEILGYSEETKSCELCGKQTKSAFGLGFKRVAICEECANLIVIQQVAWLARQA